MNRLRLTSWKQRVAVVLACLAATAGFFGGAAQPAGAYPWDPHVYQTGSVSCYQGSVASGTPQNNVAAWVWYQASDGEHNWARYSGEYVGPGGTWRNFSFTLAHVPTTGTSLTVKWGCSYATIYGPANHQATWKLTRPRLSNQADSWRLCPYNIYGACLGSGSGPTNHVMFVH